VCSTRPSGAKLFAYAEVATVLGDVRRRGRRRVAHVAPILDHLMGLGERGDSAGELWIVTTLVVAGLPRPQQQVWTVANGRRFCLVVAYVSEKIDIEYDGYDVHGRSRRAFVRDRDRISELEARRLARPAGHLGHVAHCAGRGTTPDYRSGHGQ